MTNKVIMVAIVASVMLLTAGVVHAIDAPVIPNRVKEVAGFWATDQIDDVAYAGAIEYLIYEEIIKVSTSGTGDASPNQIKELETRVPIRSKSWKPESHI